MCQGQALTLRAPRAAIGSTSEGVRVQHRLGPNDAARKRVEELCRKKAFKNKTKAVAPRPYSTVDLRNSDAWLRLHESKSATVTASHNKHAIYVTAPVDRYLLPQEHMLLQGFYWEQVQVASAVFKDAPYAMARIAGNAIPMETNMVQLRQRFYLASMCASVGGCVLWLCQAGSAPCACALL
jgi:hypothetical protein